MKKIRMGVIGLGGISNVHISGIRESQDAELVAVCDIDPEVLARKGELHGIPESHRFVDYRELLACPDVDAVSIGTPNSLHYCMAMDAVRYGKPFALEKPVTLNKEEASRLRDAVREAGLPNMTCFSYRFKSSARHARYLIEQGLLGEINHIYGQYIQSWGNMKEIPLVWRYRKDCSGSGALGDLGSHILDLARFVVGKEIRKVCAHAQTIVKERKIPGSEEYGKVDVDDYCHFLAELKDGGSAVFEISRFGYGKDNFQRLEVYGNKGGLIYHLDEDGQDSDTLSICIGEAYARARNYQKVHSHAYLYKANQMQSFFDILRGRGDGLAATIEDGYVNQKVLDAIIESFEKNKWVEIYD